MIEIFGDWLMFNGTRLVRIPDDLSAGMRMLLQDHLVKLYDGTEDDVVRVPQFWQLILDTGTGRVYQAAPVIDNEPILPDDCKRINVVDVDDVSNAIQAYNLTIEIE